MGSKPRFLRKHVVGLSTMLLALAWLVAPAAAQQKPNIIMIMGDDIGWFNIGAYHQGIMAGRTGAAFAAQLGTMQVTVRLLLRPRREEDRRRDVKACGQRRNMPGIELALAPQNRRHDTLAAEVLRHVHLREPMLLHQIA